jgi:hypothetical protein
MNQDVDEINGMDRICPNAVGWTKHIRAKNDCPLASGLHFPLLVIVLVQIEIPSTLPLS